MSIYIVRMSVSELIDYLKMLDPDVPVVMDMTREGADVFYFVSIDVVERATLDEGSVIIVLSSAAHAGNNELSSNISLN